jgi:hypothetical protein
VSALECEILDFISKKRWASRWKNKLYIYLLDRRI